MRRRTTIADTGPLGGRSLLSRARRSLDFERARDPGTIRDHRSDGARVAVGSRGNRRLAAVAL